MPSHARTAVLRPLPAASRLRQLDAWLAAFAVLVGGGLLCRISLGIDLSDEGYYATFVDGWLKTGIAGSTNLVVHQTAALLVYPFVRAFHAATGSETGLVLFLRALYVAISAGAALATYAFVSRLQGRRVAVLAALYVLSFIPFSLPAPSYNTIAMAGMVAGFMLTGRFLAPNLPARAPRIGTALLATVAWTFAAIAYPTIAMVFPILLLGCLACLTEGDLRRRTLLLAALGLAGYAVAAGVVVMVLGLGKLTDMLRFTSAALGAYADPAGKLARTIVVFQTHAWFFAACVAAAGLGIWIGTAGRSRPRHAAACLLALALLLPASRAAGAALFAHAHDVVLLLALFGLLAVAVPPARAAMQPRIARLLVGASLLAGLATVASATNGFLNFPIGGLGAAVLALAFCVPPAMAHGVPIMRAAQGVLMVSAILTNGFAAYVQIYGEPQNPLRVPAVRVASGPYAGLLTSIDQARYVEEVTRLLAAHATAGAPVTILGRLPGLYLLTDMAPSALSTWSFSQHAGPRPALEALTDAFFQDPRNQPALVGSAVDPWTRPPTPAEERLLSRYGAVARVAVGSRSFALHRRTAPPP